MDPFQPIAGISLELYADLCVAMKDTNGDRNACAAIAQQRGVAPDAWFAAQDGWNQRMADPSLMGRVALAYMPIYQAALAKSGPAATCTYREYVSMLAAINVIGPEQMYARCGVSGVEWSQISTYWANELVKNQGQYPTLNNDVVVEKQRIQTGGAPMRRGDDGVGQRPEVGDLAARAQALVETQFKAGDDCRVHWSDGNKYPGRVAEVRDGRVHVTFPNGSAQWIEQRWVEKA